MNKNLNLAEILKDCPKGMELDCAIYENVEFDYVEQNPELTHPIHCLMKTNGGYNALVFTHYGCNNRHPNAKCVIFPKGKTTWEGFQRPFKDGDVVYIQANYEYIAIYKKLTNEYLYDHATIFNNRFQCDSNPLSHKDYIRKMRFATEEEKQKLFDAIKANGYKWNPETKTLDELIELKFKVGDKIRHKTHMKQGNVVTEIKDTHYILDDELALPFTSQDEYELAPNKFDITTLKPFERVLTRATTGNVWCNDFFGYYKDGWFYCSGHIATRHCIPFKGNQHLLGTTDDCDEYFKTWE